MHQYLNCLKLILRDGERASNRTGIDTLSVFGHQMKFDLREGFPVVTTKKLYFASVVKELLWFLRGDTNTNDLGCKIWDGWAKPDGEVPFCYGQMWREYPGRERNIDQLNELLDRLKKDPTSRRHIICAWNPEYQDKAGLAWCHLLAQFNVKGEWLDCAMVQRSCDAALGLPFNIASYALLTHLIAARVGLKPRYFIHSIHDLHIYENHLEGIMEQLEREPFPLPELVFYNKGRHPADYRPEDFELVNYQHHSSIKFDVAI